MQPMRRIALPFTFLGLFCLASFLRAGEVKKLAQTSMKWLSIPVGARPIAMGGAYYTMVAGASDVFWNPSGTAFIEAPEFFISHMPWIADIDQEAAALSVPLGKLGVISVSARYIDFGPQQGTRRALTDQGWEYTEEFTPISYQVGLGFAQRITNRFSYGLHFSYAYEKLGSVFYAPVMGGDFQKPESRGTSMGLANVDFGVTYYTGFRDLRLGMTLRNFSYEKGYGNVGNPIPMDLRFGLAMDLLRLFAVDPSDHRLTLTWDVSHPRDYSERLHFGAEYVFSDFVALRAGYKSNYDEEGLAFGAGILPTGMLGPVSVGLDYAVVPFGVFGSVQVFSFSLRF